MPVRTRSNGNSWLLLLAIVGNQRNPLLLLLLHHYVRICKNGRYGWCCHLLATSKCKLLLIHGGRIEERSRWLLIISNCHRLHRLLLLLLLNWKWNGRLLLWLGGHTRSQSSWNLLDNCSNSRADCCCCCRRNQLVNNFLGGGHSRKSCSRRTDCRSGSRWRWNESCSSNFNCRRRRRSRCCCRRWFLCGAGH